MTATRLVAPLPRDTPRLQCEVYISIHISIYIYIFMYINVYTYKYTCITYVCMYVHIHIYTFIDRRSFARKRGVGAKQTAPDTPMTVRGGRDSERREGQ